MKRTSMLFLLALGVALAGCGGDKKQQGSGVAGGEVLPGSTSDAMLPYDTVKSQAPLAPKSAESGDSEAKPTTKAAKLAAKAKDEEAPAAPAPAATEATGE